MIDAIRNVSVYCFEEEIRKEVIMKAANINGIGEVIIPCQMYQSDIDRLKYRHVIIENSNDVIPVRPTSWTTSEENYIVTINGNTDAKLKQNNLEENIFKNKYLLKLVPKQLRELCHNDDVTDIKKVREEEYYHVSFDSNFDWKNFLNEFGIDFYYHLKERPRSLERALLFLNKSQVKILWNSQKVIRMKRSNKMYSRKKIIEKLNEGDVVNIKIFFPYGSIDQSDIRDILETNQNKIIVKSEKWEKGWIIIQLKNSKFIKICDELMELPEVLYIFPK